MVHTHTRHRMENIFDSEKVCCSRIKLLVLSQKQTKTTFINFDSFLTVVAAPLYDKNYTVFLYKG